MFNSRMAARMANKKRKGFTLVELVVVILIVAILAAAIFLGGATIIRQARERQVQNDLKNFGTYVQDMLYDNPALQYHKDYTDGEYYTYDPTTKLYSGVDNDAAAIAATANWEDLYVGATTVLNLFDEYLTDDFMMGAIVDAWDNPYCFSYDQVPSTATGESSSCIVVINSLGNNSLDETSNGCDTDAQKLADVFKADMDADTAQKKWASADEFLADTAVADAIADGDDYGVVIIMIDGQVSVGYYGF